jgi:hypothetical protein
MTLGAAASGLEALVEIEATSSIASLRASPSPLAAFTALRLLRLGLQELLNTVEVGALSVASSLSTDGRTGSEMRFGLAASFELWLGVSLAEHDRFK